MRRFTVLVVILLSALLIAATPALARQSSPPKVTSQGLGLTQANLTQLYGAPQAGQSSIYYQVPEGEFYVGFAGGMASDIYWQIGTGDGLPLAQTRAIVDQLLPSDATPIDTFADPTVSHQLTTTLYHSAALARLFAHQKVGASGNILVIYESSNPLAPGQPVASVRITLGAPGVAAV